MQVKQLVTHGSVRIGGKERTFAYDSGHLTLEPVAAQELFEVLALLEDDMTAVPVTRTEANGSGVAKPPHSEAQPPRAQRPTLTDTPAAKKRESEPPPPVKEPPKEEAKPEPAAIVEDPPAAQGVMPSDPWDLAGGTRTMPDVAIVQGAKALRDVLGHLYDCGFKSKDEMVDACKRLADQVPLIRRVGNLEDRIERTLAVMDLS